MINFEERKKILKSKETNPSNQVGRRNLKEQLTRLEL